MNRIKITHLIASNFVGGPEKQILAHAARLRGTLFDFSLITFLEGRENEILTRATAEGLDTRGLTHRHPLDPRVIRELAGILRADGVDLLVCHSYRANVVGRLASQLAGTPCIAVSRGWTAETRKIRLYEWLDRRFLHFADHVVAVSEGQRKKILALGVSPERVSVIHNCIDTDAPPGEVSVPLRWELKLPPEAVIIASAGRLSPEKNFGGLVRVAAKVLREEKRAVFVVFGEGVLRRELEEQIGEAGVRDRFLLPGFRPDFSALLSQVDIFVLPSFTEGLPNVVLEAFAARLPVVATAVGGTPEVVVDGEGGFLVHPLEEDKMAAHILELVRRPDRRHEMGLKGHDYIRKNFSFEKQNEAYRDLYFTLAGRRSRFALGKGVHS